MNSKKRISTLTSANKNIPLKKHRPNDELSQLMDDGMDDLLTQLADNNKKLSNKPKAPVHDDDDDDDNYVARPKFKTLLQNTPVTRQELPPSFHINHKIEQRPSKNRSKSITTAKITGAKPVNSYDNNHRANVSSNATNRSLQEHTAFISSVGETLQSDSIRRNNTSSSKSFINTVSSQSKTKVREEKKQEVKLGVVKMKKVYRDYDYFLGTIDVKISNDKKALKEGIQTSIPILTPDDIKESVTLGNRFYSSVGVTNTFYNLSELHRYLPSND